MYICCFSRWCWLIPLRDKNAPTLAKALLERVFLDIAGFPVVLRSDRAEEFMSDVVAYLNAQLEIRHVLGSSYHPQSQGIVERMHRTMSAIGTGLCESFPEEWPSLLR